MPRPRPDELTKAELTRVSVYLEDELARALKHLSVEEKRPVTAIIQELVSEYVERHSKGRARRTR